MTVTEEGFSMEGFSELTSRIRQNLLHQIVLLYSIILIGVALFDQYFLQSIPHLYITILFAPLFPAYYADKKWRQLSTENINYLRLEQKHNYLKFDFLASGILFSTIFYLISAVHTYLIGFEFNYLITGREVGLWLPLRNNFIVSFSTALIYCFVFTLGSLIIMYKLYRLGSKESIDTNINRFYDHPLLIIGHLSYFLIGSYVIPVLFYPFQPTEYNEIYFGSAGSPFSEARLNPVIDNIFYYINLMSFGFSLQVMLIFPLFFIILIGINSIYFPHHLRGRQLNFAKSGSFQKWILLLTSTLIATSYILYQTLRLESFVSNDIIFWLFFAIISGISSIYFLINVASIDQGLCNECGFYGGNDCIYCENREDKIKTTQLFGVTKLPKCPNCSQYWDNLSRRCSNCKYTIVLTCDNCSQTINPLWRKCNLCGEPRKTIPEIALSQQNDNRFSYTRARYVVLILITLPFAFIDVLKMNILNQYLDEVMEETNTSIFSPEIALIIFDDYKRILGWFVFVFAIMLLIYRSSTLSQHPKLQITDEFIRIIYSELYIVGLILILYLLVSIPQISIFFALIPLVILTIVIYRRYQLLRDYIPFSIQFSMEEINR